MTRPKKDFDAVAMMRSIRDRISTDIEGMTLEEELAWLSSQELSDPFLKRLRDGAECRPMPDPRRAGIAANRS
jgi:hypothetical protein